MVIAQGDKTVCLLTPPFVPPMMPNLGIPALAAHLRAHGIATEQIDLNIRFHDDILGNNGLFDQVLALLTAQFQSLDEQPALTGNQARTYLEHFVRVCRAKVLKRRSAVIAENLRTPMPQLEPLPFGYPSQQEAFQMVRLAMSLLDIRPMTLGANVGVPIEAPPADTLPLLHDFYARHICGVPVRNARVFGISLLYDSQISCTLVLADCLRRWFPSACLVIGGPYVKRMQNERKLDLLKAKFDMVIIGEGEDHLLRICRRVSENRFSQSDLPQVITSPAPLMHLQTPAYDPEQLKLYWSRPLTLMVQASRGCYWNRCAFCSYRECYGGPLRTMAPRAAADMLDELRTAHGCRHFEFVDDCMSPDFAGGLVSELEQRGMAIHWSACARFDRAFDPHLIARMARAGCRRLTFGMESVSQRILDFVNKGTLAANYLPILRACKENDIAVHLNWIAGLPGETPEELRRTVDFLREHTDLYAYQFGQVFTLEAASGFATHPEQYNLPPDTGQRAFHGPKARKRLYEIIHTLPLTGTLQTPPSVHGDDKPFSGWSPFVAEHSVHYDLSEVAACASNNAEPVERQDESQVLYHIRTQRHIQLPGTIISDIRRLTASASTYGTPLEELKVLYENDFIA